MEDIFMLAALGGITDDELEYLILEKMLKGNIVEERGRKYGRLNLGELTEKEARLYFRFEKRDLKRLATALGIPDEIKTDARHTASGIEGLCICLRRLAYPNRLKDLEPLFGLSAQSISDISNTVIHLIYSKHKLLLRNLNHLRWLNYNKMKQYAQAVANKGAALTNCWGFIGGTARAICKPSIEQGNYFSVEKGYHCVKYQSVVCPDGIVASLTSAYPGRRHDAGIFRESKLYQQLEECASFPNVDSFVLYGDQAYGVRRLLLCPYNNTNLTEQQQLFNNSMSSVRQAAECGFGKISTEFSFLDSKQNQKLLLQNISEMYTTAMILTNCHTCLYGSQTSTYFNVQPPQLEQYLKYDIL